MSGLLCYKDELNKQVCCLTAYILRDQSSYTRGVSNTLDKKLFHPVQAFIVNEKDRPLESSAFFHPEGSGSHCVWGSEHHRMLHESFAA